MGRCADLQPESYLKNGITAMNALYFLLAMIDFYLFRKVVEPKFSGRFFIIWLGANIAFAGIFVLSKG